ncbi:hypothetical protein F5887DRAFT_963261 [Amanita rubescens]|nr:hypothetical protein F5887DRAFT_963261 [Amanita rubescens]
MTSDDNDLAMALSSGTKDLIDLTPRNRIESLLFKLAWRSYPLFHSREHDWICRLPSSVSELPSTDRLLRSPILPIRLSPI